MMRSPRRRRRPAERRGPQFDRERRRVTCGVDVVHARHATVGVGEDEPVASARNSAQARADQARKVTIRSTTTRWPPGEMCSRPGRLGTPWLLVLTAIPRSSSRPRMAALARGPKISRRSASGVTRLSSTSTRCLAHSAAVANARSYSGNGQLAPAGLTNASLLTRRSRSWRSSRRNSGPSPRP
jgi:hypothetical protein